MSLKISDMSEEQQKYIWIHRSATKNVPRAEVDKVRKERLLLD